MSEYFGMIGSRVITVLVVTIAALTMMTSSASAEVIDRIVAQVNDEIITLYELEEAALPYLVQEGQNPQVLQDDDQREALLGDVLDNLIGRILIAEAAEEMELEVSEAQIDEWLTMMAQQQNMTKDQFRQAIGQFGIDYETYREIVHDNLLQMQIAQVRAGGGGVSESEVDSEYRRRFGSPDAVERRLEVRHILLIPDQVDGGEQAARQRLEEMREQIEAGEASFAELAESESQGPGAERGGNIGTFARGELAASFEDIIFELEVGELTGPVDTEFGIHLIEVLNSEEAENQRVAQQKQQIRAELQEREMERQLESFIDTLRSRAFVDVRF